MIWTGPEIQLDDLAGIRRLLQLCVRLAEHAAGDARFRQAAAGLAVRDIFKLVRAIRIRRDPHDVELVVQPEVLLHRVASGTAAADCEDIAALVAALAIVNDIPARLVAYGTGERWKHIAAELQSGGRWLALDPVAGSRLDSRPTPARETEGTMPTVMIEGVAGPLEWLAGIPGGAARWGRALLEPELWEGLPAGAVINGTYQPPTAGGILREGVSDLISVVSPVVIAVGEYKTAKEMRKAMEAQARIPAAVVKVAAPVAAPAPTFTFMAAPAAPAAAPVRAVASPLGISTTTLLIGGAVLAALMLLKGK